jgi:hypothetical protein
VIHGEAVESEAMDDRFCAVLLATGSPPQYSRQQWNSIARGSRSSRPHDLAAKNQGPVGSAHPECCRILQASSKSNTLTTLSRHRTCWMHGQLQAHDQGVRGTSSSKRVLINLPRLTRSATEADGYLTEMHLWTIEQKPVLSLNRPGSPEGSGWRLTWSSAHGNSR